jgi:hypothetical protein
MFNSGYLNLGGGAPRTFRDFTREGKHSAALSTGVDTR